MDDEIEQECLRVMRECEEQARGWGLDVCVRTFAELGIPSDGHVVGRYVAEALPEWGLAGGVAAVDVATAIQFSNPVDRLASWTCHELGHSAVDVFERQVLSDCLEPCHEQMRHALRVPTGPAQLSESGRPVYCGHEWPFVRALVHLQFRMQTAGTWVSDQWSFPGSDYGLSSLSRYRDALGGEPEFMADRPIIEVMKRKSPAAFLRLWNEDLARAAGRAAPAEKIPGSSRRYFLNAHSSEEPSSAKS